jgi:thioredoxin 1
MKNIRPAVLVLLLMLTATVFFSTEFGRRDRAVTGPPLEFAGRVTMVQLMAEHCPACREMEPVLEAVRGRYAGTVDIIFMDVFSRPGISRDYGITIIPAQIFYDRQGRERRRHEGMMSEAELTVILDELLLEQAVGISR